MLTNMLQRSSVQVEGVAGAIPLHGEFFPTPMFRSDRVVAQSMIKYEELRLGSQIGVGHSGVVYKGIWRGMAVAGMNVCMYIWQ